MRILYVGPYRDPTGYGKAAEETILALDEAGAEVVCRPLKLSPGAREPDERLLELEGRSSSRPDVVIQHLLPSFCEYHAGCGLNLCAFATETSHFRPSGWARRVNALDGAIVFNQQSLQACRESGLTVPVEVIPHPSDVSRFERAWEPHPVAADLKAQGYFVFYTIGELVRRKNLAGLLRSYYLEFSASDPVVLLVKADLPGGAPASQSLAEAQGVARAVAEGLRLPPRRLPRVEFLCGRLSEAEMMGLHVGGDVFVQPSFGEAWSIPAFDAMGFGKTPIVSDCGGYADYVADDCGWRVPVTPVSCFGMNEAFPGVYTGEEDWFSVDDAWLRLCLRDSYQAEDLRRGKAQKGRDRVQLFSRRAVGAALRKALETWPSATTTPTGDTSTKT